MTNLELVVAIAISVPAAALTYHIIRKSTTRRVPTIGDVYDNMVSNMAEGTPDSNSIREVLRWAVAALTKHFGEVTVAERLAKVELVWVVNLPKPWKYVGGASYAIRFDRDARNTGLHEVLLHAVICREPNIISSECVELKMREIQEQHKPDFYSPAS